MLIDCFESAKCTSASVENCFTCKSPCWSIHRFITMSITPFVISSLNRDSWYVSNEIARTALDLTGAGYLLSTSFMIKLSSFN